VRVHIQVSDTGSTEVSLDEDTHTYPMSNTEICAFIQKVADQAMLNFPVAPNAPAKVNKRAEGKNV
jgi:hypothetical protein